MKLYIKNMVCNRCITAIEQVFNELEIPVKSIQLGEIETLAELKEEQLKMIQDKVTDLGFALLNNKKKQIIEKIKNTIINLVHHSTIQPKQNISDIITAQLSYDYSYLSNTFTEIEGITIEKYLINQKIEKIKELLVYDELSLNEISDLLGYSSVAYLSNQFKKNTGLSPSYFKKLKIHKRKPLDEV